jgi:hypothetical protein
MKLTITGYDESTDTFTYDVLGGPDSALLTRYGQTITGDALNELSVSLPHSKPGQMSTEEMLLAMTHTEYWVECPTDLIGHTARSYSAPTRITLRPQEMPADCVPLNTANLRHIKIGSDK